MGPLRLTVRCLTHPMRAAFTMKLPAKIGEQGFTAAGQAKFAKKLKQLLVDIAAISPIYREHDKQCAGPLDAWQLAECARVSDRPDAKDLNGKPLKAAVEAFEKDPLRVVEFTPSNEQSRDAMAWIALLWSWPASPFSKNPGFLEEIAEPLIRQLGIQPWIDHMTGADAEETPEEKAQAVRYEEATR